MVLRRGVKQSNDTFVSLTITPSVTDKNIVGHWFFVPPG